MKRILTYMTTISLLAIFSLAAGGPVHAQDNSLPAGVIGPEWKLLEIQRTPQDVEDTSNLNLTLTFDDKGLASGYSTCNSFSAPYQAGTNQVLTFGDVLTTLRACVDTRLMDLETEYYSALDGVTSYSFDGTTLQLFYNNGGSILKFGTTTTPGMPRTGVAGVDYATFVIPGLVLVLLGAGLLLSRRFSR